MIVIRKENDKSNDKRKFNGYNGCTSYIIIDDLIDTGKTINRIMDGVRSGFTYWGNTRKDLPSCAGIVLYYQYSDQVKFMTSEGYDIPVYSLNYYSSHSSESDINWRKELHTTLPVVKESSFKKENLQYITTGVFSDIKLIPQDLEVIDYQPKNTVECSATASRVIPIKNFFNETKKRKWKKIKISKEKQETA